jgi:hypothetical protein
MPKKRSKPNCYKLRKKSKKYKSRMTNRGTVQYKSKSGKYYSCREPKKGHNAALTIFLNLMGKNVKDLRKSITNSKKNMEDWRAIHPKMSIYKAKKGPIVAFLKAATGSTGKPKFYR